MKRINFFLTMSLSIFSIELLPVGSESWKVQFFDHYMQGYKDIESDPSHSKIAEVLEQAFQSSTEFVPERERELALAIQDQIHYFATLQDPEIIKREVKKCTNGMKLANSLFGKIASKGVKANKFVDNFKKEYDKRMSMQESETVHE